MHALAEVLRRRGLDERARIGALRLAGRLGNSQLGDAIAACWNDDAGRNSRIGEYLFAAAYCCGEQPEYLLGPVLDAWAALPGERVNGLRSPRDRVGADHVRWAFAAKPPMQALRYLVERARGEPLKWQLILMLHSVDDPDVVEFIVTQFAEASRSGGMLPYTLWSPTRWDVTDGGRSMSGPSRARLLQLWTDRARDRDLRAEAFRLWSAGAGPADLDTLRCTARIDGTEPFAAVALWRRIRLRDATAVPELLVKLSDPSKSYHWWRGAERVWSADLRGALDSELVRRGATVAREWHAGFATDPPISELLMAIPPGAAEAMLLRHWEHLRFSGLFIQAALYVARPALLAAARDALCECPTPASLLEHLATHWGIRETGHDGLTRRVQVEALAPHVALLDEMTVHTLWMECNERGWFDLRRGILDPHVSRKYVRLFLDAQEIEASFDRLVEGRQTYWADAEIDAWLATGANIDAIAGFLRDWLGRRQTLGCLEFVAAALGHAGLRRHLAVLDVAVARDLDSNENVKLFVKLPSWFRIDTPIGPYNPDWAFVTERDEKLYFVRETKSTLDSEERRTKETNKIACGRKHFETIGVNYDVVTSLAEVAM